MPSPPKLMKDPTIPPTTEDRLTELERRARRSRRDHRELRAMLGVTCGKVDGLCDTLRPVVEWATVQIHEEKKDAASWRETWRGARREFITFCLKAVLVLSASALGIGWVAGRIP